MHKHPSNPKYARIRPERARLYPGIDRNAWFPVVSVSDLGVRVELGNHRELFLFWEDVEVQVG